MSFVMSCLPKRAPVEWIVCAHPERAYIADGLVAKAPAHTTLNRLTLDKFADATLNPFIPNLHDLTDRHVLYIASWRNPYEDMAFLVPLAQLGCRLTIVVPFMATGTMERETSPGVVATANVDSFLLSSLPGHPVVMVIDLHTRQNHFYFKNCVAKLPSMMDYINRCMQLGASSRLGVYPFTTDGFGTIVFPDDGAHKRFGDYFAGKPFLSCTKMRGDNDERFVTLNNVVSETGLAGRRCTIVDDLTRSGNTLIECAKLLRKHGATTIIVLVVHAAFTDEATMDRFVASPFIDHIFTTDTVATHRAKLTAGQGAYRKCLVVETATFLCWQLGL